MLRESRKLSFLDLFWELGKDKKFIFQPGFKIHVFTIFRALHTWIVFEFL